MARRLVPFMVLGKTPFGNDNLDYGSQAPFHMGFYHLDWLTRMAQPDLLRTYPLWRIALFGELGRSRISNRPCLLGLAVFSVGGCALCR